MDSNRTYFGMTTSQLGIIGGLAFLLCCLIGVAGWLVFGNGFNLSRPPAIPPTAVSTATMIVLPTLTPTTAPTPIPYEQLIPQGWKQHKTSLIEIWLPSDYRKTTIKDLIIYDKQITVELTLSRTLTDTTLYNLYVIVAYKPLQGDSLRSHLESAPTALPETPTTVRFVEQRNVLLNGTPAIRLLYEGKSTDNLDANALVFVFLDGNTVWYVEYFTQINEFYNQLETFEKSILTFRPVK